MSYYREQLEEWVNEIDVDASLVYDVGGADKPIDKRVNSWDVGKYRILDLPEYDINKLGSSLLSPCGRTPRADVVFCLEVFEYVYDPRTAILNLTALMKPSSTLYVSFPFIYPIHNPFEMDYLRYTKHGVMKLLEEAGLKLDDLRSRYATAGNDKLQEFYSLEGMRRAKEYTGHNEIGYLVRAIKE